MSLYDTAQLFTVKRVEHKKNLEARDGKPAKVILKLGLVAKDGTKVWPADFFADQDPVTWPSEGVTEMFTLEAPKQEGWSATAKKPRLGGGGGFKGRSPADTKRIERMAAHKTAAHILGPLPGGAGVATGELDAYLDHFKGITDWLVEDLP